MSSLALAAKQDAADLPEGDAGMLAAARAGDLAAFERLMRQYERLVLVTALRLAGQYGRRAGRVPGSLPEAVQESGEADSAEDTLPSWLYRVTVNACHDLRRKRRPEDPVEDAGRLAASGGDPHQALAESERGRALELSLRMLPEKERAALVLRDLEGLSTEDVARVLGIERGDGAFAGVQGADESEGLCRPVFWRSYMNCVEWEERVALHAGGDLAGGEAAEVERHLGECPGCQVMWSGLRDDLAVMRAAHAESPAAAHFTAVRGRVMAELERQARPWWRMSWVYGMAALAAVLLALALWPRGPVPAAPRILASIPPAPVAPVRAFAGSLPHGSAAPRHASCAALRARPPPAADHQAADGGPEHRYLLDCGLSDRSLTVGNSDQSRDASGKRWPDNERLRRRR